MIFSALGKTYRIDKRGIWRWNPVQGDSDNERLILSWKFVGKYTAIILLFALSFVLIRLKYIACMEIFDSFWYCALQR